MLFGASYYHEYQPYERLDDDIRLMTAAGISLVRMGESTWSSWESEDGRFVVEWMERTIDAFHRAHIKVVLGTPTYAIPPWLHHQHPEIMAQDADGRPAAYGWRQNIDVTHPTYRHYAERVIRAIVSHFAPHPAVIGFQLDNETGIAPLYNPAVFQRFVAYLQATFTTVEHMNEVWGLTYWSQRLTDWSQLWTPAGNSNPGYALEWRRFQTALTTEFLAWQAAIVRPYLRPDQWLTHNLVHGHGYPASDRCQIGAVVDITSDDPYYATQDALLLPAPSEAQTGPEWLNERGVWSLFFAGDMAWSARQSNFLVAETNALSIGNAHATYPAYDGQWRLAAYTLIARGANAIGYWHWHTLHYGWEMHWQGILNHDLQPNRCYQEISRIGRELQQYGDLLTDLQVDAEVGLLYSQDSKYALERQPCLPLPDRPEQDPYAYQRIVNTFYRALFDAHAQIRIVHPSQAFEQLRLLVVPALYIADDALLDRLVRYAEGGGHLLLTFRSGYADHHGRARWVRAPGRLRQAVGASYTEYSHLNQPLALRAGSSEVALPPEARATAWADGLQLEGATPLAFYEHPHFGRFPAVVSQPYGQGRVTYSGTLPNGALGTWLAQWAMAQAGLQPRALDLPAAVRVSTARSREGQRLWFLSNWSWTAQTVTGVPLTGRELFSNTPLSPNDALTLGPWDIKIVVES